MDGWMKNLKILKRFFNHIDTDVYLSVREENESAIRFYEKVGMERVGYINWSGGKIKGCVYKFSSEALDLEEAA